MENGVDGFSSDDLRQLSDILLCGETQRTDIVDQEGNRIIARLYQPV